MPNCFQLTEIGKTEPSNLVAIDEAMCKHFNQPIDPDKWLGGWYDTIGLSLAMGQSWSKMREIYTTSGTLAMIDYLEQRYTSNAWYQGR